MTALVHLASVLSSRGRQGDEKDEKRYLTRQLSGIIFRLDPLNVARRGGEWIAPFGAAPKGQMIRKEVPSVNNGADGAPPEHHRPRSVAVALQDLRVVSRSGVISARP